MACPRMFRVKEKEELDKLAQLNQNYYHSSKFKKVSKVSKNPFTSFFTKIKLFLKSRF